MRQGERRAWRPVEAELIEARRPRVNDRAAREREARTGEGKDEHGSEGTPEQEVRD